MKYVFFDLPLESIHKQAFKAAEASRCAGEQGKYWEMHDQLFAQPPALEIADLNRYATGLNLDSAKFQECMNSGKYASEIRKDISEGQRVGVRGTPTFLIGVSEQDLSKVHVLKIVRGARPYSDFKQAIEDLVTQQK